MKPRYSVCPYLDGYTVERTIWQKVDNGRMSQVRDIAGVFTGEIGHPPSFGFAKVLATNLCEDLNQMLPIVEQSRLPIFKRPSLLEQLAAL